MRDLPALLVAVLAWVLVGTLVMCTPQAVPPHVVTVTCTSAQVPTILYTPTPRPSLTPTLQPSYTPTLTPTVTLTLPAWFTEDAVP